MTFGFREPYQVLGEGFRQRHAGEYTDRPIVVDAEMVIDSCRFKMDLAPALQRTVHGQVKGSTQTSRS